MLIEKQIQKYIIHKDEPIVTALKKISENKDRTIFAVDEYGVLQGVLTDGDFRRWIVNQKDIDLNQPLYYILNTSYKVVGENVPNHKIEELLKRYEVVPIIDGKSRIIGIAKNKVRGVPLGSFEISEVSPTFIIAEIGNNHNGDLMLAKKLVDEAVKAGADCAKFQMRDLETLYNNKGNANDASEDLGSQYTLDLLSKFQLPVQEMIEVFDYCKSQGILPLCTPWDARSLDVLEQYGMVGYKLASADLTNHELLKKMARLGKPIICSTGMSNESEIKEAVDILNEEGVAHVILHCNSTYPAPFKDVNLNYLDRLKELTGSFIGYSGHERGIHVAVAAVAKGAKVIEKHFTLDRGMEGNDHKVSLLPAEFLEMVQGIRQVEQAMGTSLERKMSQGELINRENLAKSLVINCDLTKGEIIRESMIEIRSPGRGIQPNRKSELVGKKAKKDYRAGDFFYDSDLMVESVEARNYKFPIKWGVPVRYHDYKSILKKTNPDLLEFHLSYKDLDERLEDYFDEVYNLDFVVHMPELFSGDHLLDLCSLDEEYRQHSVREMQKVINLTRDLKKYFNRSTIPMIVTNMGGFTKDEPLKPDDRQRFYSLIEKSLCELDIEGVEILPQTMPPFPWHFGGQRYQNLFMDPIDMLTFCQRNNMRVCLDTSHSKLACNHHGWSFKEFMSQIGPITGHIHIVDARGVDGEGLQIGEGEIDFIALARDIQEYALQASFIPEIWQGHKNDGEGFWIALDRLEKAFRS